MSRSNLFDGGPERVQPQDFDEIPRLTGEKRQLRLAVEAELVKVYQHNLPIDTGPFIPKRTDKDWAGQYDNGEHGGALAVAAWYFRNWLDIDYAELEGDEPAYPVKGKSDISSSTHRIWAEVGNKDKAKRFFQNLGIEVDRGGFTSSTVWWNSNHWKEASALLFFPYGNRKGLLKKSGRPRIQSSKGWKAYWFVPDYNKGLVK